MAYHRDEGPALVVCHRCEGEGRRLRDDIADYHRGTRITIDEGECPACKGSGILRRKVSYSPFVPREADLVCGR